MGPLVGEAGFATWSTRREKADAPDVATKRGLRINNSAAVLQAAIKGHGVALARSIMAPSLSFEALVKITFANFGSKVTLLQQLESVEGEVTRSLAVGAQIAERYANDAELIARAHTSVFVWRFLWDYFHALRAWASWARGEVHSWPDVNASAANCRRTQRIFPGRAPLTSQGLAALAALQPACISDSRNGST